MVIVANCGATLFGPFTAQAGYPKRQWQNLMQEDSSAELSTSDSSIIRAELCEFQVFSEVTGRLSSPSSGSRPFSWRYFTSVPWQHCSHSVGKPSYSPFCCGGLPGASASEWDTTGS